MHSSRAHILVPISRSLVYKILDYLTNCEYHISELKIAVTSTKDFDVRFKFSDPKGHSRGRDRRANDLHIDLLTAIKYVLAPYDINEDGVLLASVHKETQEEPLTKSQIRRLLRPRHWLPYASVFLSYGGPDEDIAKRFYEGLEQAGVKTWFFKKHASFGKRLHRTMHEGINTFDRVVLLCSRHSLKRAGVMNEIERVLSREATEGGAELLIPVALDDFIFTEWSPARFDLAEQIRERVIADFRGTFNDKAKFESQFERLLRALQYDC